MTTRWLTDDQQQVWRDWLRLNALLPAALHRELQADSDLSLQDFDVLVALTDHGREILLADRRRRDAWLAQRLRELTPAERAVLREAAPLIQRLATS